MYIIMSILLVTPKAKDDGDGITSDTENGDLYGGVDDCSLQKWTGRTWTGTEDCVPFTCLNPKDLTKNS